MKFRLLFGQHIAIEPTTCSLIKFHFFLHAYLQVLGMYRLATNGLFPSVSQVICLHTFLTWLRIRPHFLPIFSTKSKIGKFQVFNWSIIESRLSMMSGSGARIGLSCNRDKDIEPHIVFLLKNHQQLLFLQRT